MAWLSAAFGFVERLQIGESHRSQLTVGDGGWGHQWTFSEALEDVDPASWGGMLRSPREP